MIVRRISINSALLLLSLSAVFIPAGFLTFYTIDTQTQSYEKNVTWNINTVYESLSSLAELALVSEESKALFAETTKVLFKNPMFHTIELLDAQRKTVLSTSSTEQWSNVVVKKEIFPIYSSGAPLAKESNDLLGSEFENSEKVIEGYIVFHIDLQYLEKQKQEIIKDVLVTVVIFLLVFIPIVVTVGRKFASTLAKISSHLNKVTTDPAIGYQLDLNSNIVEINRIIENGNTLSASQQANQKNLLERLRQISSARQQADESKNEAVAANLTKSRFLASVSHELLTPLFDIKYLADSITRKTKRLNYDSLLEPLDHLKSNVDFVSDLIEDILAFSELETKNFRINPVPFFLADFLQDIIRSYEEKASREGNMLSYEVLDPEVMKHTYYSDQTRIRMILVNFITNAIKYTTQGKISLNVYGSVLSDKQEIEVTFEVKDSGRGISPVDLPLIFNDFYRAEDVKTSTTHGVGLGLAISRRLANLMNAKIDVESKVGVGSKFSLTITLPIHAEAVTINLNHLATISLLVVEDDSTTRDFLYETIKPSGVKAHFAVNATEAELLFEANEYDLVFIDCYMPKVSGPQLARSLQKKNTNAIPIIGMSIDKRLENVEECMDAGMDDFIEKQRLPSEMLEYIMRYTEARTKATSVKMPSNKSITDDE